MIGKILTGSQANADSALITPRSGRQGDQIVSGLHGAYYEQTLRGNVYRAANQAVATTTVGLATTYTGLVLSNPITSSVNLEILQASLMQSVIQAVQVEAFAIATGFNASTNVTHTTPVTPVSCLVGATASNVGLADVSATLPTAPTYDTFLCNSATATANSTGPVVIDINGSIILKPGAYALFVSPAQASVAGMWFSFKWAEIPA